MASLNENVKTEKNFKFEITHFDQLEEDQNARTGKISIKGRHVLETPNFISTGSRGVIPHITPDVLSHHLDVSGVYMALEDFVERATKGDPPILKCPSSSKPRLHTFTAMPASIITVLASRRSPAVPAPSGNSNEAVLIFTSTGFQQLKCSEYSKYVSALKPDIAIALADVSHGSHPGVKRLEKMGDRTSKWVETLVKDMQQSISEVSNPESSPAIFAPILPIDFQYQFEYLHQLADELADSISGLAFYSSSLLPDIPATTSLAALPRLSLDEPSSPHSILRQISLGMDIFTIPFLNFATDNGIALTFEFPDPTSSAAASAVTTTTENVGDNTTTTSTSASTSASASASTSPAAATASTCDTSVLPLGTDMWQPSFATSFQPLLPGCACYACAAHTAAYVQHLLSAREMLGWLLLQVHNHRVLARFFAGVRASVRAGGGRFAADCRRFAARYDPQLPRASGQLPRARGYQFRAQGPGEARRNKPAWGALRTDGPNGDDGLDGLDKQVGLNGAAEGGETGDADLSTG